MVWWIHSNRLKQSATGRKTCVMLPQVVTSPHGRKELVMTRYIVTATRILYGYEISFSFTDESMAKAKMAQLDADVRYTYTYKVERR